MFVSYSLETEILALYKKNFLYSPKNKNSSTLCKKIYFSYILSKIETSEKVSFIHLTQKSLKSSSMNLSEKSLAYGC